MFMSTFKFFLLKCLSCPWLHIAAAKRYKQMEDLELPLFDLATIASATNNFSSTYKLGEGGFGPVYKVKPNISFALVQGS